MFKIGNLSVFGSYEVGLILGIWAGARHGFGEGLLMAATGWALGIGLCCLWEMGRDR